MAGPTTEQTSPTQSASDATFYTAKAKEFVELHDQVQTSVRLLDSLETFLSTFQKDLSAVSGQISDLQDRSNDIDNRLKSRRKIEKPLSSLITDITIPPPLATLILDSDVGEPWITAVEEFEKLLNMVKARSRVKAARDLGEVAEGLRIVAATKLRGFFLALFKPIRGNVTTNMQVMQTSILLKYKPLFSFLQRQAPNVAHEVQRSYIGAARVYYETGFRRYARSLGWIKARTVEKFDTIVSSEQEKDLSIDPERLAYGKIEGPSVTLAYMADEKTHKEPLEALLRSLMLVFMDNATAEYTFIKMFFTLEAALSSLPSGDTILSSGFVLSPGERQSIAGSDYGGGRSRAGSMTMPTMTSMASMLKEEQANSDTIWKQVLDPVLEYIQTFVKSVLDPIPPVIPLLTMIRLTEDVVNEVENRSCPAVVTFVFGLRLQMWPVFQKAMTEHVEALKKLAEGGNAGYFSRTSILTDATVSNICKRYIVLFNSFIALTEQEAETMIFSNLLRLRQELAKLILRHTNQLKDTVAKATAQSAIYDSLLQGLSKGTHSAAHPKSQQELAYWANLQEEVKRKIISVQQAGGRR